MNETDRNRCRERFEPNQPPQRSDLPCPQKSTCFIPSNTLSVYMTHLAGQHCRDLPKDPVGDVETSVQPQSGQVVGGNGLGLPGSLKHHQLGKDRDGFEVDGERPEDLGRCPGVGDEKGENNGGEDDVLESEGIEAHVRRWPGGRDIKSDKRRGGGIEGKSVLEPELHEVEGVYAACDEENLHEGVVERDIAGGQQVDVPSRKHDHVEELSFEGDS